MLLYRVDKRYHILVGVKTDFEGKSSPILCFSNDAPIPVEEFKIFLALYAEIIRNRRVCGVNDDDVQLVNYDAFGKDWVHRFMSRHPQLASARRKLIEAARVKDVSIERLIKWFENLQSVINEYKIEPGNLYNMDKSEFAIGDIEASQRIINITICQVFQAKPGRRE